MKQIFLIALAIAIFSACRPAEKSDSPLEGPYEGECYVKRFVIDGHFYIAVYTTCDGRPGHKVLTCVENHCAIFHSPRCSCHNVENIVDINESLTGENDW